MISKKEMKRRTKEEKEKILHDVKRIGVVAGCRKHGIDPSQYYDWLRKYNANGLQGLEDRRGRTTDHLLKKAEKENKLLKELLAEKELEIKMKDELLKKKREQWQKERK